MWTLIISFIFVLIVLAFLHEGADPTLILYDAPEPDNSFDPEDSVKRVEARLNAKN